MRSHRRGVEFGLEFRGHSGSSLFIDNAGRAQRQRMGEYVLVEAVLWQAIREYRKLAECRTRRALRQFNELDQWFLENDQRWDFSFINLCQILDIEPAYIRAALKSWRDRHVQEHVQESDKRFHVVRRKDARRLSRHASAGRLRTYRAPARL